MIPLKLLSLNKKRKKKKNNSCWWKSTIWKSMLNTSRPIINQITLNKVSLSIKNQSSSILQLNKSKEWAWITSPIAKKLSKKIPKENPKLLLVNIMNFQNMKITFKNSKPKEKENKTLECKRTLTNLFKTSRTLRL